MGQGDHSKQNTVTIKVPDPIVTFLGIQFETSGAPKTLQKEIQEVILGASQHELPPNYWINVRKLFGFLDKSFFVIKENILKYAATSEVEDLNNILSQLESQTAGLRKSFESLLQDGISESERNSSTFNGLGACQGIIGLFADRNGILFKKSFLTSGFLVTFGALYKSFSKMWDRGDSSRRRKEMERLEDTIEVYKNECIRERLDNIKMLRTQSESFNVHDYSYEAQVRKDVAFGGTINDYYDKRPKDQINYRMAPVNDPSDADNILAAYKNEVKMEYEVFFNAALREPEQEGLAGTSTN